MSSKTFTYEFIDHTADVGIKARGATLEDVFKATAKGMFDLIAKDNNIKPEEKRELKVERDDIIMLFKQWLEELLYLFDTEGLVFSEFEVKINKRDDLYTLNAIVYGEKYNPEKHGSGVEIKAVTYHMMDIWKENDEYFAQVIFDV